MSSASTPRLLLLACSLLLPAPAPAGVAATAATKAQQKCLTKLDKAVRKAAGAQSAEQRACVKAVGKGRLDKLGATTFFACTRGDAKGKVAKATAKLESAIDAGCTGEGEPAFGLPTSASKAATAAVDGERFLLDDLLSPNFAVALADCASDEAVCRCQQKVHQTAEKLLAAELKAHAKCKKAALAPGKEPFPAGAAGEAELGACVLDPAVATSLAALPKKVAKARDKLRKSVGKHCADAASSPLPGWCIGLAGDVLSDCIAERVDCRACFLLSQSQGFSLDCDAYDDGVDNGSCPLLATLAQETVDLPSPAQPAETPGTPGVVVTSPKLVAQFGGDTFDLNRTRYTRYFFRNAPSDPPDAILVLVPGFEGGAGGMKPLAENLLVRSWRDHGQVIEVWAYDRRTNQLEDDAGLAIAEQHLDAEIALDWLYGAELGLPLHPELAAGPNRRAEIYNVSDDIPFLASWTPLVFSRDIDVVVEAARAAAANQNVFLGGHSAGTGFAARYASTDFDLTGAGPPEPGYAKLRGLVLLEGGGGSALGAPPTDDDLDRIEARFDGGLFGAVRDEAPRCVDGTTPCTLATEDVDCAALANTKCTEPTDAYAVVAGLLNVRILASSEPAAIQAVTDADEGRIILRRDFGAPGNNAVAQVPDLGVLGVLPEATVEGSIGYFLDDDFAVASFSATSLGYRGPNVNGLDTWIDLDEAADLPAIALEDNGPAPTDAGGIWGVEREVVRADRLDPAFFAGGTNFVDWYFPSSGLSVTSPLGLDTAPLSVGRGRRDIANATQAANIDVPVIGLGGSNGLTPTPSSYLAFAQSIAPCGAPACDGTPRVVDAASPSLAFPTFGGAEGGFEVYVSEGYAHVDVLAAEDLPGNEVVSPIAAFLARYSQ